MVLLDGAASAINCTDEVTSRVAALIENSLAENSRRAYLSDLREFERWGGTIPSSPELVASYLAAQADRLAVATLIRHVASISKAHQARGLATPTQTELVRATLRGIRRTRGVRSEGSPAPTPRRPADGA